MAETESLLVPLFPLPIAALPGEVVPLHIFEERYKEMVAVCRAPGREGESRPFGILLIRTDGTAEVGCLATIERILREHPDGRLDLLAVGRAPFAVLEVYSDRPYFTARVALLRDEDELVDPRLTTRAHALWLKVAELSGRRADTLGSNALSAYRLAVHAGLPPEVKQQLLELRSETRRLKVLTARLQGAISEAAWPGEESPTIN